MKGLKIVRPVTVTPSMLSTDVPEDDYDAWDSGTPYEADERVIYEHKVYQSLQASNTGKTPDQDALWWVEVGSTNRWKAFDLSNSTQTQQDDSMCFEITAGTAINALAVLNIRGVYSIKVTVTDPQYGVVYERTASVTTFPSQANWYTWYFGVRVEQDRALFLDLPSYPDATTKIEFTGGAMAVGVILVGKQIVLGDLVARPMTIGFRDYSRKQTNEWGDTVLQQRAYAETQSLEILLPNGQIASVKQALAGLRATPTLWIPTDQISGISIYGWLSTFSTLIEYAHHSIVRIELEGLT